MEAVKTEGICAHHALNATASGIDLAKRVVDSLPGESLDKSLAVSAKLYGYHVNFRFDGVEVSDAYHDFVSVDADSDKVDAAPLMRELLSKVELGQKLAQSEIEFAHAPVLTLSLLDTQDAFCFALADLLVHSGAPWAALNCINAQSGRPSRLELSFQWL